jgi:hypothetical protein
MTKKKQNVKEHQSLDKFSTVVEIQTLIDAFAAILQIPPNM